MLVLVNENVKIELQKKRIYEAIHREFMRFRFFFYPRPLHTCCCILWTALQKRPPHFPVIANLSSQSWTIFDKNVFQHVSKTLSFFLVKINECVVIHIRNFCHRLLHFTNPPWPRAWITLWTTPSLNCTTLHILD